MGDRLELPHPRPFIRLKTLGFTGDMMPVTVMRYLLGDWETQTFIDLRHIETFSGNLRFGMERLLQSTVQLRELNISGTSFRSACYCQESVPVTL